MLLDVTTTKECIINKKQSNKYNVLFNMYVSSLPTFHDLLFMYLSSC